MNKAKQWFTRSAGQWLSNRRYHYLKSDMDELIRSDLTVSLLSAETEDFSVLLSWHSRKDGKDYSEGEMLCQYDSVAGILHRNIGYFSEEPTDSRVSFVDTDTIVLSTEYGGMRFREEIRLLDSDTVRLRQTLGWRGNNLFLAGQYFEQRVYPEAAAAIN
jgi:CpeS-like protein